MERSNSIVRLVLLFTMVFIISCHIDYSTYTYYQILNKTDKDITIHVYTNPYRSEFTRDTIFQIKQNEYSSIFIDINGYELNPLILNTADSIDLISQDTVLKRYRYSDLRITKTLFETKFYDSIYTDSYNQKIHVYRILDSDFC